jgi:hypothetical protein
MKQPSKTLNCIRAVSSAGIFRQHVVDGIPWCAHDRKLTMKKNGNELLMGEVLFGHIDDPGLGSVGFD